MNLETFKTYLKNYGVNVRYELLFNCLAFFKRPNTIVLNSLGLSEDMRPILLHEYAHYLQYKYRLYPEWLSLCGRQFLRAEATEVWPIIEKHGLAHEKQADRLAKKMCKRFFPGLVYNGPYDKTTQEQYMKSWNEWRSQ